MGYYLMVYTIYTVIQYGELSKLVYFSFLKHFGLAVLMWYVAMIFNIHFIQKASTALHDVYNVKTS